MADDFAHGALAGRHAAAQQQEHGAALLRLAAAAARPVQLREDLVQRLEPAGTPAAHFSSVRNLFWRHMALGKMPCTEV